MGFMDKLKNMIGIEDEYYDDDYANDQYYDQSEEASADMNKEYETELSSETADKNSGSYREAPRSSRSSNIVNMSTAGASSKMKICIQEPLTYDDGPSVIDNITSNRTVVLNLEMLEVEKKRQIFDFVSGGVYALNGNIQKVTKDIYVIVPKGVEVDGHLAEAVTSKSLYQL